MFLQLFGSIPIVFLLLALVVSILVVAFGTYIGVVVALQSFFGASSWDEVDRSAGE